MAYLLGPQTMDGLVERGQQLRQRLATYERQQLPMDRVVGGVTVAALFAMHEVLPGSVARDGQSATVADIVMMASMLNRRIDLYSEAIATGLPQSYNEGAPGEPLNLWWSGYVPNVYAGHYQALVPPPV